MKKIIAAFMTTAILLTAFAGCGKEKAAETSTTAQTSENTTNEVTKVTSGNALSIPTDELSENAEFLPSRCRRHRNGSDCSKRFHRNHTHSIQHLPDML